MKITTATQVTAADTTLVVYRKDRFCPATSALPEDYRSRLEQIDGVIHVGQNEAVGTFTQVEVVDALGPDLVGSGADLGALEAVD